MVYMMKIRTKVDYPGVWLCLDDNKFFFNDEQLGELATKMAKVSAELCREILNETIKLQSEGSEATGLGSYGDRKATRH